MAQTRAIGDTERGPVLDARRCFEQSRRFLHAQHVRQLAWMAHDHQHTCQIPPLQRHQEQEPQRRDRAVDGRGPDAALMLIQLEATDVLGRRSIGRGSEEGCEAPDVTNVVLLGMGPKPRMSMSRCMRWRSGVIGALVDRVSQVPLVEGTPWSDRSF